MEATTQVATGEAMNASQVANPAIPPSPVPSASEMAQGGSTPDNGGEAPETTNDGSHDWGQWIAIGIISLTIVSLVMQIYTNRKTMLKLDKDDADMRKDINEIKMNVKKQMGDKYESLD
jgi:hypothetical protein